MPPELLASIDRMLFARENYHKCNPSSNLRFSFYLFLCLLSFVTQRVILKIWILLKPIIKNKNDVLNVVFILIRPQLFS
jgi:hypothetical protein